MNLHIIDDQKSVYKEFLTTFTADIAVFQISWKLQMGDNSVSKKNSLILMFYIVKKISYFKYHQIWRQNSFLTQKCHPFGFLKIFEKLQHILRRGYRWRIFFGPMYHRSSENTFFTSSQFCNVRTVAWATHWNTIEGNVKDAWGQKRHIVTNTREIGLMKIQK